MAAQPQASESGPVRESERIVSLDLIRGVAVLGILLMNAVAFNFGSAPHFNLSVGGSESWLDWVVGVAGEVFVDQKFMGLFSLLFGAGMILFIDRASKRGRRAVMLNLWRNALLLLIGIVHGLIWEGDVLTAYAVASVFLVAMRKLPNWALVSAGVVAFALSVGCALVAQNIANTTDASLAGFWTPGEYSTEEIVGLPVLLGFFLRALGLILIGAGLYRAGFMDGGLPGRTYRLTAMVGLGVGLPLAAAGVVVTAASDYSREIALHRPDSQHARHDSGFARVHESHHPVEQPGGQPVEAASAGGGQDGADELPCADGVGRAGADDAAGRRGLRKPERRPGVRVRGVGHSAMVVAGVAWPVPVRANGVALASRHLSQGTAASATGRRGVRRGGRVTDPPLQCGEGRDIR